MQASTFQAGLRAISAALPYGKRLTDEETAFLWLTIPPQVRELVTDEMFAYACTQRRIDPEPNKELSLDMQLLTYVFRTRNGQPAFDWGLKTDLSQRMAASTTFHPIGPVPDRFGTIHLEDGPTHPLLTGI